MSVVWLSGSEEAQPAAPGTAPNSDLVNALISHEAAASSQPCRGSFAGASEPPVEAMPRTMGPSDVSEHLLAGANVGRSKTAAENATGVKADESVQEPHLQDNSMKSPSKYACAVPDQKVLSGYERLQVLLKRKPARALLLYRGPSLILKNPGIAKNIQRRPGLSSKSKSSTSGQLQPPCSCMCCPEFFCTSLPL